jgi:hypothetical protein
VYLGAKRWHMKKCIPVLLAAILVSASGCAPQLAFNNSARIDTLFVMLEISPAISEFVARELRAEFTDFVADFNSESHAFKLRQTEKFGASTLAIRFLATRLVSSNQQTAGVLVSLAGLSLPFIMAAAGAEFVLFFWYFPRAASAMEVKLSDDINGGMEVAEPLLSSPGFLKSPEKQVEKHGTRFYRYLTDLMQHLETSYRNNQKNRRPN